jgi:hypothetical protein
MLTTTVSVTVKLTPSETKLLRFFADQCLPPRQGERMYESLNTQGLIHRPGQRDRYEITELGRQTVATLDQDADLPTSHQLGQSATGPTAHLKRGPGFDFPVGAPAALSSRGGADLGRRDQTRSNRSRFITLTHAATKSATNLSFASSLA